MSRRIIFKEMKKPIVSVLTICDCDPDRPLYGGVPYSSRKKLIWHGIENAIFKGLDVVQDYRDTEGSATKVTWCVRCDEQIGELYGDSAWVYKNFSENWKYLREMEHEIGWHPHFWKWNRQHNTWYQCIEKGFIKKCLIEGYKSIPTMFKPNSTKMGWAYHSNYSMELLNKLGILVDLSAVPGINNKKYIDRKNNFLIDTSNWLYAPHHPYRPYKKNYQGSNDSNEKKMDIIVIPVTTFTIPYHYHYGNQILNLIRAIRKKRIFSWRTCRISTLSPTKLTGITKKIIENVFVKSKQEGQCQILHSYFHPDELLVESGVNSMANFKKYFQVISTLSKKYGIDYRYVTASELLIDLKSGECYD